MRFRKRRFLVICMALTTSFFSLSVSSLSHAQSVNAVRPGKWGLSPNEFNLKSMEQILAKSNTAARFAEILAAANNGDSEAQVIVCIAYFRGVGVAKNLNEAARWSKIAAEAGNVRGMSMYGLMLEDGYGVAEDANAAVMWYRKAADLGSPIAINNLGSAYTRGKGVEKNETEGFLLIKQAAESGQTRAMVNLGSLYYNGTGTSKDYKEALRWYLTSALQGDADGHQSAGFMLYNGLGAEKNEAEAFNHFRSAANLNQPDGMNNYGTYDLSLAKALHGAHNGQNAAAAFACCRALGLSAQTIAQGLYSFGGLDHRLQEIGRIGNVRFFNDSKATNADAASQALSAFDKIRWIAGGRAKTGGIEPLRPLFNHISSAYLIGEAAEDFSKSLGKKIPHKICKTMDVAVKDALKDALQTGAEEIIVLSPACASFDQYTDFEARGDDFVKIAKRAINEMAMI